MPCHALTLAIAYLLGSSYRFAARGIAYVKNETNIIPSKTIVRVPGRDLQDALLNSFNDGKFGRGVAGSSEVTEEFYTLDELLEMEFCPV